MDRKKRKDKRERKRGIKITNIIKTKITINGNIERW